MLTNAAEKLYALKDSEQAGSVAQRVRRAASPPATDAQRRVAWTVLALHRVRQAPPSTIAEKAYGEVIELTPEKDAARAELVERLAASIYKQGEQARATGQTARGRGELRARRQPSRRARRCARPRSTTPPRR